MEEMSIGEFARRSRLSPKALRLYDGLGLLSPARVDELSGYRYYERGQLEQAGLIATGANADHAGDAQVVVLGSRRAARRYLVGVVERGSAAQTIAAVEERGQSLRRLRAAPRRALRLPPSHRTRPARDPWSRRPCSAGHRLRLARDPGQHVAVSVSHDWLGHPRPPRPRLGHARPH